jgi:GTP-binding protein
MEIRNIAIIAHVDHGKTTLTDSIMKQTGMFAEGESMDSNSLEKERGITIYSKNTSCDFKGTKINIVDTPGHADFGSEVERVLRSIDCVLLIVDAQEGPMPQTRFVLKKSLELGLKPIVVINKVDKPAADADRVEEEVLELFMDLGANSEQLNFPVCYAIGREGVAMRKMDDPRVNMDPLLDMVLEHVKVASGTDDQPFRAQAFNLAYDNYMGRLAIVRVSDGVLKSSDNIVVMNDGAIRKAKVAKLFAFKGIKRVEVEELRSGDIGVVAGIPDVFIGETLAHTADVVAMPMIHVDEPTIEVNFLVNNSPFAGREGKFVTGRQIRDRLEKELEVNVGLRVDFDASSGESYPVAGRGELHVAILVENMRREGFELQISQPKVIIKMEDGVKVEPFEEITIDTPNEFQGAVIEKLGMRGAIMMNMIAHDNTTRMVFEGPTRGLLGYRSQFIMDTRGEGIMASRVIGFRPYAGEITRRHAGSMISMETGKALGFSLFNLQARGTLYITPGTEVYEGMVVGNTSKGEQMTVNPTKGKQLTNMRASGTDEAMTLVPAITMGIENGMEIMDEDEYLEVTPLNVRLRKQYLTDTDRAKAGRKI